MTSATLSWWKRVGCAELSPTEIWSCEAWLERPEYPETTRIGDLCSSDVVTVSPGDDLAKAVALMRECAVRRLPVTEAGRIVGVLSLGDLAMERDEQSALTDISAEPPNR